MARKPRNGASTPQAAIPHKPERERVIESFMNIHAEKPIEEIGFAEIAKGAGISLAQLRGMFGSTLAIFAAHVKETDEKVLSGADAEMAEESPRERLFDVLMRRLEILEPRKAAVRSLLRSCRRHPSLALALNPLALRSQQWMLSAADIGASGPQGIIRAQGLALMFASVLRVWMNEEDPGHARTMAALDRVLARGQRLSGFLDDLCRVRQFVSPRRRRRRRDPDDEVIAV
jgi:AcrR family transcriptional regulator